MQKRALKRSEMGKQIVYIWAVSWECLNQMISDLHCTVTPCLVALEFSGLFNSTCAVCGSKNVV